MNWDPHNKKRERAAKDGKVLGGGEKIDQEQ